MLFAMHSLVRCGVFDVLYCMGFCLLFYVLYRDFYCVFILSVLHLSSLRFCVSYSTVSVFRCICIIALRVSVSNSVPFYFALRDAFVRSCLPGIYGFRSFYSARTTFFLFSFLFWFVFLSFFLFLSLFSFRRTSPGRVFGVVVIFLFSRIEHGRVPGGEGNRRRIVDRRSRHRDEVRSGRFLHEGRRRERGFDHRGYPEAVPFARDHRGGDRRNGIDPGRRSVRSDLDRRSDRRDDELLGGIGRFDLRERRVPLERSTRRWGRLRSRNR
mmetsp:Transcript_27517/g.64551  ORF Transcript_27517/g.64551 Transcript_27517/m.64551 type:complete len:269 (+) Transcript_27517:445-1251(+)